MASTLTSAKVASTVQARAGIDVTAVKATYELTAALVINDVIQMCKIPAGAQILEVILATDDLDSHATPTIVLEVGDGDDPNRFIDASTVAQAGGVVRLGAVDGVGYIYTADDTIDVKVPTAPATGATSGTINLVVLYTMQGF